MGKRTHPRHGPRISQVRKFRGMSQRELAQKSGVTPAAISLIETGRNDPSIETLKRIAAALQVPDSVLLESTDTPLPLVLIKQNINRRLPCVQTGPHRFFDFPSASPTIDMVHTHNDADHRFIDFKFRRWR